MPQSTWTAQHLKWAAFTGQPRNSPNYAPVCVIHAAQPCVREASIEWAVPAKGGALKPITLCTGGSLTFTWTGR